LSLLHMKTKQGDLTKWIDTSSLLWFLF